MAASQTGIAADTGKLLLRLSLAGLLLLHGISKIAGGAGSIVGLVEKAGLPGPLGYFVYVGEVLAPLLLIVGLWTRAAAAVVAVNMAVAVYLVHRQELFTLSKSGGWALELQGFYFLTALALVLLGAGRFSVGGAGGRLN
jgi:putative oxidoreductase